MTDLVQHTPDRPRDRINVTSAAGSNCARASCRPLESGARADVARPAGRDLMTVFLRRRNGRRHPSEGMDTRNPATASPVVRIDCAVLEDASRP